MTRTVDEIMRNRRARVGGFYRMQDNVEADVVDGFRHPNDTVPDDPYETTAAMSRTPEGIMRDRRARVGEFYRMENVEADVVAGYRHPQDMVPDNPYETVHHPNDGYDGKGDFIPTAAQSRHSTPPPLYSPRVLSQPPPAYSGPPPARDVPRDVPRDIAQADFEVLPPGEGAAEYSAVPPAVDGRSASRLSIVDSIFDADDQVARRARAVLNMPQSDDNHDRSETTGQLARRHRMGFGKRVCRVFARESPLQDREKGPGR